MRRVLYWKRLLIVGVATFALVGVVFGVHRVQIKSQVSILKDRAEKAEAEVNGDKAKRDEVIALYARYLKFRPNDEAAFQKYAHLLFEAGKDDPRPATNDRVVVGVESFLRAFPRHTAERKQLAELYAQNGKYLSARSHIEMLLAAPNGGFRTNIEVLEMAAACEQALGDLTKAIEYLDAAIATKQAPVRVYKRAMELNNANKGDPRRNANIAGHLDTLLRDPRFVNDLSARVAAAQFQRFLKEMRNARDNITHALTKMPGGADDPDALLAAAELELDEINILDQAPVQLKKAEAYLKKAHELDRKNLAVGALLAEVLTRQGKAAEGIKVLQDTAKLLTKVDNDYLLIVDRLIDLGEQTDSAAMAEKVAADESRKLLVPYFRGRLAVLKKDWPTAKRLLEEAAPRVAGATLFHKKAMVDLAACYAVMQNPDKQLEYCRRALRDDPGYPPALVGEAEALSKMGRIDEALKKYRVLVNTYQLIDYRTELVRLELLDVLVQPVEAGSRNWASFEQSLGEPPASRPAEIHILHADSLLARERPADAAKLLRDWLEANPKHAKASAVFVALARMKDGGRVESSLAILEEAEKKVGDTVDIRLAKIGLLTGRAKVPVPAEFDAFAVGVEKFPKNDQFRVWFGLGQAAGRVADLQPDGEPGKEMRAAAIKYLRTAADLMPKDLTCRAVLLDHALAAGRMDVVNQAREEMAKVEGKDGPVGTLGYIAIRLPEVRKITDGGQRAAVKELRELARRIRDQRPGWSRVYIAIAQLDEIEGLNDAALANYTEAIEKGERQELVIRRAVDLYRVKKQDDKAVGMLNKLSTELRLPDDLERYRMIRNIMLAPVLARNERPTIDRNTPANSKDFRIQLLRGALLSTIGDDPDALVAFRRAVELNDKVPETWASLVAQLVRLNKVDDAKRAVAQAEKSLMVTAPATDEAKAELRIGLGGLHEMVGDTKAAFDHFTAASTLAPTQLNPIRHLVQFYQRTGQTEKADELLLRAKDSTAQDVARWARRHLAVTMTTRPNAYNVRGEALALVERNLAVAANDPEDVKVRAVIWTVDPLTREEGLRVLRSYGDRGDLTPEEFYLLGRLSFDVGNYIDAKRYFELAARIRPGVTAEHLAAVVRVCLALNQVALAESALERLKTNNPNGWEATREEARVLHKRSKDRAAANQLEDAKKLLEQARATILKFPGWDAVENIPSRSGPLFEELGLPADAEAGYKKFLVASTDPGAHQPLGILYIRQKQTDKAISLAFEREPKAPVLLTARLLTGAIRAKRPDAATEAKIEKWLDAALGKAASDPELEAALIGAKAELHDARGDYANAIKEYERAVAAFDRVTKPRGRKDAVVNNLCMLLALHQPARANDAVKMMTDLIAIRGPVPAFLDTRAVAYLVSSRPAEAVKDLEMALVQYDRATYHFHLAWAFDLNILAEKRVFAVDELKKARFLGLTADDLHPIEFDKYKALLTKYKLPVEQMARPHRWNDGVRSLSVVAKTPHPPQRREARLAATSPR